MAQQTPKMKKWRLKAFFWRERKFCFDFIVLQHDLINIKRKKQNKEEKKRDEC